MKCLSKNFVVYFDNFYPIICDHHNGFSFSFQLNGFSFSFQLLAYSVSISTNHTSTHTHTHTHTHTRTHAHTHTAAHWTVEMEAGGEAAPGTATLELLQEGEL